MRFRPTPHAAVAGALLLVLAGFTVVHAQGGSASDNSVPPSFTGGCAASANIAGYGTVDPAVSGGVYTVPKSGSATYTGSVPVQGQDRTTSGKVQVELPLGLPAISIKSWGGDNTDGNSDSGTVTWDIPSWLPGNVELTVSGFHQDEGVRCEGRIKVKLDGGGFAGPIGIAAVALTIVSLAGLAWAMIPRRTGA